TAVFLSPILSYYLLPRRAPATEGRIMSALIGGYGRVVAAALGFRRTVIAAAVVSLVGAALLVPRLGGEFIPHLSEGSLVANTIRLAGVSVDESVRGNTRIEALLLEEFPDEVESVWSRI